MEENDFSNIIKAIVKNKDDKLYKDGIFAGLIRQRCGKKRLSHLNKTLGKPIL